MTRALPTRTEQAAAPAPADSTGGMRLLFFGRTRIAGNPRYELLPPDAKTR